MGLLATYASSKAPSRLIATPQSAWKRTLDLSCCILAVPVLAVCTLVVAVLMRLFSAGPIFFTQERVGYMGRTFRIYKFRTMHVGDNARSHESHIDQLVHSRSPMQKLDAVGDSRLIPGGWFLRATGLDELPQIVNIFKGEMSIVGPRPCIPYEYRLYSPTQRKRFHSMPGLTGLWQVSGKNRRTFDEMVELDLDYLRRRSLRLDIKIILLTPIALWIQLNESARKANRRPSARSRQPRSPVTRAACLEPLQPSGSVDQS